MITERTDAPATQEDVREQRLLRKARRRAEFYRALWVASMIILCTLAAIMTALTRL